jgi:hypothetical protein
MKKYIVGFLSVISVGCAPQLPIDSAPDYANILSSGVWGSNCVADQSGNYHKETFSLKTKNVSRSTTYFADQDCLFPEYTVTESGTAELSYPQWGLVFLDVMHTYSTRVSKLHETETDEWQEEYSCIEGDVPSEERLAYFEVAETDVSKMTCVDGVWNASVSSPFSMITYIGGNGKEGNTIDYTFNKVTVLAQSETAVSKLKELAPASCGLSNLRVGSSADVTGDCSIPSMQIISNSTGKTAYDVVVIRGDAVHFGDETLEGESNFGRYTPWGPRSGGRRGRYENQVKNDRALAFDTKKTFKKL